MSAIFRPLFLLSINGVLDYFSPLTSNPFKFLILKFVFEEKVYVQTRVVWSFSPEGFGR